MKTYRILISLDVKADSLESAYEKVYDTAMATGLPWESLDEFYEGDEEGDPADLQAAAEKVLSRKQQA